MTWPSGWGRLAAVESLARWLGTLGAAGLARLIDARPETRAEPVPGDLTELAERLCWRTGAVAALQSAPLPAAQLIEVLLDTRPPTRAAVAARIGCPVATVDEALHPLVERALVWPDGDQLRVVEPLAEAVGWPLGLGPPVVELIRRARADELRALAQALGVVTPTRRADLLSALTGWYAEPERIRAVAATAPGSARALLEELAWGGPEIPVPGYAMSAERIPGPVGWAVRNGLVLVTGWRDAQVPREVALALRGPDWRPALDAAPPPLPLRPVDPAALAGESAVAATAALDQFAAVLAGCAATPPALLRAGGVGVREVKRLAKACGLAAGDVALWLELGASAGLLAGADDALLPTPAADDWHAADPAARLLTAVRAWWSLTAPASWPGRASPPPVLARDGAAGLLVRARRALLRLAAQAPAGQAVADPGALVAGLGWQLPVLALGLEPVAEQVAALWREAGRLGLLAHDALTPLGRALVDRDDAALAELAGALLPEPTSRAIFQADLTAVVAGTPAPALADALDSAADRESRGTASTWRFTATSVRRALDAGRDADELLTRLRAAAAGDALPQALTYLVSDVARRHGRLRVREVGCVLHAAEPALLVEVAATRELAPLGLSLLAPTVLASAAPPAATLAALRAAGYAPIGEDASGAPLLERLSQRRAPAPSPPGGHSGGPSAEDLAARLLSRAARQRSVDPEAGGAQPGDGARPGGAEEPGGVVIPLRRVPAQASTQARIARHARQLTERQLRLLAEAIDADGEVRIGYVDSAGQHTRRVIEPLELDGDTVVAFCRLRDEERHFLLERIESVNPV